jgi:hypothetical protein
MELIKTLEKLKSYLLQGAYQGAEHVLDGAIVEARSIQSECETLRVRIGEMAAEIERLQGVIDAANAQEPVAVACGAGKIYVKSDFSDIDSFLRDCKNNTTLYARPIPAQPSPAVAVPDYKEGLFQLRQQAENWSTKLGFITSVINSRKISLSAKEREFPHLLIERLHTDSELLKRRSESPRITEQDVRQILDAYWDSTDDCGDCLKSVDGRALLNKLNGRYERG